MHQRTVRRMLCRLRRLSVHPARTLSSSTPGPTDFTASSSSSRNEGGDTLGRRLLSLIYPKRSAVVVLHKWAEQGKPIQKYQLNRVVRELRSYKRYKHALEVRGLASAEKFFEDLPERMKGQSTCTSLLHAYVQNKMSDKAEELMKQMSVHGLLRCPIPFNHMLALYISTDKMDRVEETVRELKKYTAPDELTYNLRLTACSNTNDVKGAERIFEEMKEKRVAPDWVTYSILTSVYVKAAKLEKARGALEEMERRASRKERAAYCSLISLHASTSDRENVYRIWDTMRSMFWKMSDTEYKCMLSSLAKLGDIAEAEGIYEEWESVSGTRDSRVPNILLAFYVRKKMMHKAAGFHARTIKAWIEPSYTTWELLAWGYLREEMMSKALDCLKRGIASLEKWRPDVRIVRGVFDKLEKLGDVEDAEEFLVMLRAAGCLTTENYNSLLRTYAKARRMPLIVAERMRSDGVELDGETRQLLRETSRFCVATNVSTLIS